MNKCVTYFINLPGFKVRKQVCYILMFLVYMIDLAPVCGFYISIITVGNSPAFTLFIIGDKHFVQAAGLLIKANE